MSCMNLSTTILAGLIAVGSAVTVARAQDGPSPRPDGNTGDAAYPYDPARELPGRQLDRVPDALAQRAAAQAVKRQRNTDLQLVVNRAIAEFERSGEFTKAVDEERAAYQAYLTARTVALAEVLDDPQYRSYAYLRDDLTEEIADRRAEPGVRAEHLVPMASQKLEYAKALAKVEAAALARSDEYARARDRLVEASRRVAQLRADFEFKLVDDRKFADARASYRDSRIAAVTAEAYLHGVIRTAEEALDYGRYLNRDVVYKHRPFYGTPYPYDIGASGYYGGVLIPYYGYGRK